MSVRIIVDTGADMRDEILDQIQIMPLIVRFGDRELTGCGPADKRAFYELLLSSETLPTTSQATPDMFARAF